MYMHPLIDVEDTNHSIGLRRYSIDDARSGISGYRKDSIIQT